MSERDEQSRRTARVAATVVIVGVVVMAFGALGGVGFAKNPASAAQYQYGKITVCHRAGPHGKRETITIGRAALPAHLRHGDTTGPCSPDERKPGRVSDKAKVASGVAGAAKGRGEPKQQDAPAPAPQQAAPAPAETAREKGGNGKGHEVEGGNDKPKSTGKGK